MRRRGTEVRAGIRWLPAGPTQRRLDLAAHVEAERSSVLRHARRPRRPDAPRRAPRPRARPRGVSLELGLDHGHDLAARRRCGGHHRRSTRVSEMNDTSIDRQADRLGQRHGIGVRRGRAGRRGSAPSRRRAGRRAATRPAVRVPRREHRRALAPRCNRQSVKPPVEAPTSRQTRPVGVDPERVERAGQLLAAARDEAARRSTSSSGVGRVDQLARLAVEAGAVADRRRGPGRPAAAPGAWCAIAARPALDEQLVEPRCAGSGGRSGLVAPRARRSASRLDGRSRRRDRLAHPARAMPGDVEARRVRRRSPTAPWSTNRSPGRPMIAHRQAAQRRVGQAASASASSTAEPKPPVSDALLERHDELLAARAVEDQLAVERLGEARVDDADRPARRAASRSATSRPRMTIGPKPTIRRSLPSRSTSPSPDRDRASARPPGRSKPASRG